MTEQREVVVVRWPGPSTSSDDGLAGLLSAYHLRTESEKGQAVADVNLTVVRQQQERHAGDAGRNTGNR